MISSLQGFLALVSAPVLSITLASAPAGHAPPSGSVQGVGQSRSSGLAAWEVTSTPTDFPDASSTGVPTGTTLKPYKGPQVITKAGKVIDGKLVAGGLVIRAANVVIRNSRINGSVSTDEDSRRYSFSITDSEVHLGEVAGTGIGAVNFTVLRVEVTGGNRSMNCWKRCDVRDSYVHGQMTDETGSYHESGIRMGSYGKIVHNTISCDAPDVAPDAGCSAPLTGYGDFGPVRNMLIKRNFFMPTTGGFCTYGGSSRRKPYSDQARNVRFIENTYGILPVAQRERPDRKSCGYYGNGTDYDAKAEGNVARGNVNTDGEHVKP